MKRRNFFKLIFGAGIAKILAPFAKATPAPHDLEMPRKYVTINEARDAEPLLPFDGELRHVMFPRGFDSDEVIVRHICSAFEIPADQIHPIMNEHGRVVSFQRIIDGRPICNYAMHELEINGDGWLTDFVRDHGPSLD